MHGFPVLRHSKTPAKRGIVPRLAAGPALPIPLRAPEPLPAHPSSSGAARSRVQQLLALQVLLGCTRDSNTAALRAGRRNASGFAGKRSASPGKGRSVELGGKSRGQHLLLVGCAPGPKAEWHTEKQAVERRPFIKSQGPGTFNSECVLRLVN